MGELQSIQGALERAASRRRWSRALRGMWTGLLIGSVLWLTALVIFKLAPIERTLLLWSGVIGLACPLLGFIIGGWKKMALEETARWVDVRQNLKERLSTALEVSRASETTTWNQLVVSDAAAHLKEIEPRNLVRFTLPKATRWALLALMLAAGLGFVPEYRSKGYVQKQADKQNIRETGKQLAELTRRDLKQRPPSLETAKASMESVAEAGDKLAKLSLTRTEALKELANVTEKLKQELKDLNKDLGLKKMQDAARTPGANGQNANNLQKQIESLQKQLGSETGNPEAMDKMQKDLAKLQEAAKDLASKSGAGDAAAKEQLSQSLSALAKQAQDMGMQMPQLDAAIAALADSKPGLFLKDLQEAMTDLEKTRDMAKSLQQLQAQAAQMGKDLAEQLKKGQPEAAVSTLQKMADQLKNGKLSEADLKKLMDEISKAESPAGDYGKVADELKKAGGQMKQGEKGKASESLMAAANELQKMLDQMNDAQSLMAQLDNLQKASQSVGTCTSWGQCNKPGLGKGGKPGSGVGTWADEQNAWGYDGQWTKLWDNSGQVRPDMAAKGLTERDAKLSDALKPEQVRGQFSPGGSMPSITLKGVSIKGQSKVAYEESVVGAQSDAQSALNQEKVPRAYQGAVRDYFDDSKQ